MHWSRTGNQRCVLAGRWIISDSVDAATVILVRHGQPIGSPWQCFMVRRHVRSDFASDVFVFPGGKVDEEDRDPGLQPYLDEEPHVLDHIEPADVWRAVKMAAIRELFEEAGILLATDRNGASFRFQGDQSRVAGLRQVLHAGQISLTGLAEKEGIRYALKELHPFSRWITPQGLPRRYDTRFFVAYLPAGQEPLHDQVETTESVWISPAVALHRWEQGEFPLVFPTRKHLERMAGFASIEQMIDATREADLEPVMPRRVKRGDQDVILVPGDEGY